MRFARFSARSLRTQIAQVFAVLVIALAGVLSFAFGEMLKLHSQRAASASLHVVATNAAKLLADGLHERSREVLVLSQSESIWARGLDSPEVLQMLARSQAMQPHSLWIGVADAEGIVRAATANMLLGQSVRERPWFIRGIKELFVGDVHGAKLLAALLPPSASGEPLRFVDFSAPVRQGDQVIGVLGVHGSWDWVRDVIEGLLPASAQEAQVQVFVFDRSGMMIYAPHGKAPSLRHEGQKIPALGDTHGPARDAVVVPWADGQDYLTSVVRMQPRHPASNLGWQVVARQPVATAFAEAGRAARLALATGLVAAVFAALLAWFAARRLSIDLQALALAARGVESGKGGRIPVYDSSREVHALSESLDTMTRRMLAAHDDMESQVRQRTAQLEAANHELHALARTDPLTGLLNRRGFDSQFQLALALARRTGRPLAVLMVDVDHFKRVNDRFGHDAGDGVLKSLAQLMVQRLRDSDVVARLGGEEFVAMLPDTGLAGALGIAEELVHAMAAREDPLVGRVTISVGVALARGERDHGEAVLRRADEALYEAKGQGRNRVCSVA